MDEYSYDAFILMNEDPLSDIEDCNSCSLLDLYNDNLRFNYSYRDDQEDKKSEESLPEFYELRNSPITMHQLYYISNKQNNAGLKRQHQHIDNTPFLVEKLQENARHQEEISDQDFSLWLSFDHENVVDISHKKQKLQSIDNNSENKENTHLIIPFNTKEVTKTHHEKLVFHEKNNKANS